MLLLFVALFLGILLALLYIEWAVDADFVRNTDSLQPGETPWRTRILL